jgi:hypothetical protein
VAKVLRRSGTKVTLEVTVDLKGSLLEMEGAIQEASNAVGRCATEEALRRFDTDGSPIRLGAMELTARGRDPKDYQSPYGVVRVERYVYQSARGGRIYCPLEHQGRIIRGATPRFARQLSHKYAQLNVRAVQSDLEENHGRQVATSYIQNVAEWVGNIAAAKEEDWEYEMPKLSVPIATVVVSLDGAMIPMADSEGYREAMVGTLSFYDPEGERAHTIYLAAAPEYGKGEFMQRMTREIDRAKRHYPQARYLGIADGAASNWSFLEQHTERQLIDFFHLSEYVGTLAQARYPQPNAQDKRALAASAVPRAQGGSQSPRPPHRRSRHPLAAHRLVAGAARWRLQHLDLPQQPPPSDGLPRLPRRAPANRIGCHRSRLQDPRQAAPVCLRNALEDQRGQDHSQPALTRQHRRTLGSVLAENRPIWF